MIFLCARSQGSSSLRPLERKDTIQDRGRVREGRSLFGILTQEGAQVLDNFIGRLWKVVINTKLDEGSNRNR